MNRAWKAVLLAAVLLAAFAGWRALVPRSPVPAPAVEPRPEAVNGARWGDTREEVEKAAGAALRETEHRSQFHTVYTEAAASRSRSYSLTDYAFLGRSAEIVYVFLDGRLASYYVLLTDTDPVGLERDVTEYLASKYGEYVAPVDEGPLKAIWQKSDVIVNYWFTRDSFRVSITDKYTAVFGVIPRTVADALTA